MAKQISFTDNDEELIQAIKAYQKTKRLNSFVAAVRELCQKGLTVQELIK